MSLNKNIRGRVLIFSGIIFVMVIAAIIVINYNSFFSNADVAKPNINSIVYYVSPAGVESADGKTLQTPTTLEGARNKIRLISKTNFPGAVVNIRGGNYYRTASFDLMPEDSGTLTAPIIYRAYKDEKPVITGAQVITGFIPANDARLNPTAKPNIQQIDLVALGILPRYQIVPGSVAKDTGPLELFFDNKPMTLARYPNLGSDQKKEWAYLGDTVIHQADPTIPGDKTITALKYADSDNSISAKLNSWKDLSNVVMHGYWTYDWLDGYQKVSSIDTVKKIITTTVPTTYTTGQNFYFENVLEELDSPGEWYVDRISGILYFYPPTKISPTNTSVSTLSSSLVNGKNSDSAQKVSNVQFIGLDFNGTLGAGVVLNGDNNTITNCKIYNTDAEGVVMSGQADTVEFSEIHDTGASGVDLRSPSMALDGNFGRKSLTPGDGEVNSNDIYNFGRIKRMGSVGVYLMGVENLVSHNYIHDGPRSAINFGGNDNTIEYNKISNVAYEVGDGGAIYGGGDWTQRGNKIQYNTITDIQGIFGKGAIGVYFDDMLSGNTIYGNIFKNIVSPKIMLKANPTPKDPEGFYVLKGGGGAVFVGGGRDNTIKNNIFSNCTLAVSIDSRGLNNAVDDIQPKKPEIKAQPLAKPPILAKPEQPAGLLWTNLQFVLSEPVKTLYKTRYPEMASLLNNKPGEALNETVSFNPPKTVTKVDPITKKNITLELYDKPGAPTGNVVASNINLSSVFLDWTLENKDYPMEKRSQSYISVNKNLNDYTVLSRKLDGARADGAVLKPSTRPTDTNPFVNSSRNDFKINPVFQAVVNAMGFKLLNIIGQVGPEKYVALPDNFSDVTINPPIVPLAILAAVMNTSETSVIALSVKNFNYTKAVDQETITVKNTGNKTVNFKSWKLKNSKGETLLLPNYSLKPGKSVVIHSGRKMVSTGIKVGNATIGLPQFQNITTAAGNIYLQRDQKLWDKTHDTLKITKPNDKTIVKKSY